MILILTIDFCPVLKRKYTLDSIDLNGENISNKTEYGAGGNGIEMSYLLNALKEDVKVCSYLGGKNGNHIQYNLNKLNIPSSFVNIKDETPDKVVISTKDRNMIIKSKDPRMTREELENFYELYNKMIMEADTVCFIGKIPESIPKQITYDFVSIAKKYNRLIFVKLKYEELKYILDNEPYLLLMDKEDLEELTNLKIYTNSEIVRASKYILDRGVQNIVVNLDGKGSLFMTQDDFYQVKIKETEKKILAQSSYMLGGYAFAKSRDYDMEMMVKLGQACGIANSYIEDDIKDMGDIKYIMNEIEVKRYRY